MRVAFRGLTVSFVTIFVLCGMRCGGVLSTPRSGGESLLVLPLGSMRWLTQLGQTTHASSVTAGFNGQTDQCLATAVDVAGNLYCAGMTKSDFGEAAAAAGVEDAFVMKMDASGGVQWVTQLGSITHGPGRNPATDNIDADICNGVAVDSSGNVYCAGQTRSNLGEVNVGGNDAFVMKLDSSGAVQWITQLGLVTHAPSNPPNANQGDDICRGVSVDPQGNVYCGGDTTGNIAEVNSNPGQSDIFVMKLNSSGVIQWVTQFGTTTRSPTYPSGTTGAKDRCFGIAVDSEGNVICAGLTDSALGELGGGSSDAVVVKLNSAGVVQWVTQLGATTQAPSHPANANNGFDQCLGVGVDAVGGIYCGGSSTGNFGEVNGGLQDAFVMKLSPSGAVQWVTQFGTSTFASSTVSQPNQALDECMAVAVDSNRNVYCAGQTLGNFAGTNAGAGDAVLFKLNTSGKLVGAVQLGQGFSLSSYPSASASSQEAAYAVAVDSEQRVYVGGQTFGNLGETAAGNGDVFLFKLE